ncbi:MAG: MG2 domain-containing protein, partial [Candidatus Hodarchaeota archaeon]
MNRQKKASLFLIVILLQYILIGTSIVRANYDDSNNPEESDIKLSQNDGISHSSPYYFPTNRSTSLMTEGFQNEKPENNARTAPYYYYNGFVLTVNLDKYVLTPGETVTINLGLTCNLTASAGKTISVKIYQGLYRDYRWYYPDYYDTTIPIYSENVTTNNEGQASILFSSTSTAGLYTVYAYAEEYKTYKEFTVGEIGIFCKGPRYYKPNHKYTAAIHIVNLTDFSGISLAAFNYSISYYEYSFSSWIILTSGQVQTDDYGYAIFNADIPLDVDDYHILRLTVCTVDGKAEYQTFIYETWDYYYYCLWGGQQETNQERLQYVVTTDKTIYTPGENILLRVLVLEYSFMNETKRPLKHTPISLTIYNPDELAIFWSSLTTDENGIITFNFPRDEDCELGSYGFEFSKADDKYRYNIKVEHYTKPVFRVEIDTNGKDFYPYDEPLFEGFVYVAYYFGQPVVGAFVELTIQNYWGDIKYSINGFTNGEGRFYFSIDLSAIGELYYSFSVQADVTDNYGRSASNKKKYTRMEDIFAYGYLSNWAPHPDEYLEYYFYVYQYVLSDYDYLYWYWSYNPLCNVTVKIEIFGIEGYPIYKSNITNEKLLATYFKTTNKFGAGKLEFKLPLEQIKLYDLFEIRLTVDLEDKRSTTSSYYYRYKKYSLDINIKDSILDPGQTLEFNVSYKNVLTDTPCTGEGIIYIYDSNHQLVGRVCEKISGTKEYYFSIPNFYPEGIYYIYSFVYSRSNEYYGGFHYHSAHESFIVGSFQLISFDTNFTNTGIYRDEIIVQIGDVIKIDGISNVSTNLPHYLEIYKRGLLFSTQLEVNDNEFSYALPVIADYAPDFTIIIYTISDLGKLYESVLAVHVEYSFSFELSTDKEVY